MNPLYQQIMSGANSPNFQHPIQKMQYIMQAMTNPAAFVKQRIPDLPNEISGNPMAIINWLQQNKGVSNQQIQQAQKMAEYIKGNGTVV